MTILNHLYFLTLALSSFVSRFFPKNTRQISINVGAWSLHQMLAVSCLVNTRSVQHLLHPNASFTFAQAARGHVR
jgi:hypothetical protein